MSAFSRAHVQRCREAWNTPQLAELFISFCQSCDLSDVPSRMRLEEIDGVQLTLDIIRDQKDPILMSRAWLVLQNFVLLHSVDDPNEMKPIEIFVERGGVELAAIELNRPEPRWGQTILTTLAWVSTNEKVVPRVVASGVHKVGIAYIREPHQVFLDISMSFIRSASAARACRQTLRADGALEAFIPFIQCNKSTEPFQMRRGFRAASVVARLAGNDESGIGPNILRNNPDLIQTTLNIFEQVLEAGPAGTVINMLVNPHFITMDLLIISTADVNKPLLVRAIPICVNALERRGEYNGPMVADIVKMFLQLSFEPICRTELAKHAPILIELLAKLVPTPQQLRVSKSSSFMPGLSSVPATFYEHDAETVMAAQMLRNTLTSARPGPSPSMPLSDGANFVKDIVRRMVQTRSSADLGSPVENSKLTASQSVIISYSWHSADLAKKLDDYLQNQGFKVWVDYRCIDGAPGDSLEQAIRDAGVMVVLATSRYKESAVCRKEVEAAEERHVPVLFIQAEESYKPDGWLALAIAGSAGMLLMPGTNQMLPGWSASVLKSSMTLLRKKITSVAPGCTPQRSMVFPVSKEDTSGSTLSSSDESQRRRSSSNDPMLLEAIATLTLTVNEMRKELNDLRMEVRGMKSN